MFCVSYNEKQIPIMYCHPNIAGKIKTLLKIYNNNDSGIHFNMTDCPNEYEIELKNKQIITNYEDAEQIIHNTLCYM